MTVSSGQKAKTCSLGTRHFCDIGFSSAAFFSEARAPARMLTASLLFSLQSYSKSGPVLAFNGAITDQGLVQVEGSSMVNLYSIVFALMRLKVSVIFWVVKSPLRYV